MQWAFDGKNTVFEDLIKKLPQGKIYNTEDNVIPYIDNIVLVEVFPNYLPGTEVEIWINDKLERKTKILEDKSIYVKMKTPYGKFKTQIKIANQIYNEGYFYAINIFTFFLCLSKELNYDYVELFKIFGNIYFNTAQNDILYKKWGWFFDLEQIGISNEVYRQILTGDVSTYLGTIRSFMYSAVYYGLKELVRTFSTQYPVIFIYRNFDGWILREDNYPKNIWNKRFSFYRLDDNKEIPQSDINGSNKKIVLLDKKFKLNAIQVIIQYWPLPEKWKNILNNLIYKIVPAHLRVEIIYL